ncbi:hypothetical protein AOQ84DRAFT_164913 [Glonium stellatum]|uniref:Uncharacterized protein n=1 Tax=Glonium stellatum TaxID=574774 RepID=A0A8E2EQ89_9PEZI|nr:hypothetical protein AOQ84DRAFT_164913 [Glonium stellatum]
MRRLCSCLSIPLSSPKSGLSSNSPGQVHEGARVIAIYSPNSKRTLSSFFMGVNPQTPRLASLDQIFTIIYAFTTIRVF